MAFSIEPLAEIEDLEARLEFELDDDQLTRLAESALVDASILVREHGLATWTADTAPPIAVMLALKAAARFMNNPMSLETVRGADETNMWGETNAKGVYLEPSEIDLLVEHRKTDSGFQAPRTYNYTQRLAPPPRRGSGYFPPDPRYPHGKLFPDYREGDWYDPYYQRGV